MRIESLKKRKRLALSEGKQELANHYQTEINETEELIKTRIQNRIDSFLEFREMTSELHL